MNENQIRNQPGGTSSASNVGGGVPKFMDKEGRPAKNSEA